MIDERSTFASMKATEFDYHEEDLRLVTVFDELVHLDTAPIDGYLILACNGGRLEVDVNGMRTRLDSWEALILPPHTRLANYMVSPDVRCDLAILQASAVRSLLGQHIEAWERAIYVHRTNHIRTDEATREQFAGYVNLLSYKLQQTDRPYNKEVVRSILRAILFDYLALMTATQPEQANQTPEGQRKVLFRRFIERLSTRHVKHQLVETYAQELCVSPGYLTKVCKEFSAKTAQQWIREYTEQDVRYQLTSTDRSVKEICEELGFPDLSFFSKFCRRAFGCSPTEFRRRLQADAPGVG